MSAKLDWKEEGGVWKAEANGFAYWFPDRLLKEPFIFIAEDGQEPIGLACRGTQECKQRAQSHADAIQSAIHAAVNRETDKFYELSSALRATKDERQKKIAEAATYKSSLLRIVSACASVAEMRKTANDALNVFDEERKP